MKPAGPRRPQYVIADLLLIIALCGLVLAVVRWLGRLTSAKNPVAEFLALELAFTAWLIARNTVRAKRAPTECEDCGRRFLPSRRQAGPPVCPQCRQRRLGPARLRKETVKGLAAILLCIALSSLGTGALLSDFVARRFDEHYWIALPLIALSTTLSLFYLLIFPFVLAAMASTLLRLLLMRSEPYVLSLARESAGKEGVRAEIGPITVWSYGAIDGVPMLTEQLETTRSRFEFLLGRRVEVRQRLRILCFEKRRAFEAFHARTFPVLGNLDGIYLPGRARTITVSAEVVRYRFAEPERTARSLFAYYFVESTKGFLPRPWVRLGLSSVLAGGPDAGELARLNRKMIASMSRGTLFDAALFRVKARTLMKWTRGLYSHESFKRFSQLQSQSRSVIEYLGGAPADDERRERFRSFFNDLRARGRDEEAFARHFGYGFEPLLEDWRKWVSAQGVGTYEAPPPHAEHALLEQVIPTIRDRRARVMDRIQAVRSMGQTGHALGADVLIDLLEDGDGIPKEEVVWALESISGMALGDDPDRWAAWWDHVPLAARDGRGRDGDQDRSSSAALPSAAPEGA
jgi:hypothetical protein